MSSRLLLCLFISFLLSISLSSRADFLSDRMNAAEHPLPAEQAFILSAHVQDDQLILEWRIAPHTYLYQKSVGVKTDQARLGALNMPAGESIEDAFFGHTVIYRDHLTLQVPLLAMQRRSIDVTVTYQGCNDIGFCYPPQTQVLPITVPIPVAEHSKQDSALSLLQNEHRVIALLSFFGFGLLLAFTPCVLPMVPILSALIINEQQQQHRLHAFMMALTYVLAMAFTYAGMGAVVARLGALVQAQLQSPLVLSITAGILVLMACWLAYDHRFAIFMRGNHPLHRISQSLPRGEFYAVALMGVIASLVVSPCVTAPLVGALSYIALTGNMLFGSTALFCLALGMGVPLIAFTWGGTALLPKRGSWMHAVKLSFSIILLAMAITLLDRFLAKPLVMMAWGLLGVLIAFWLKPFQRQASPLDRLKQALGWALLLYASLLIVGGAMGHGDLTRPLARSPGLEQPADSNLHFTYIHDANELQQALARSQEMQQPVMLDFYADWCKACVVMEHTVFQDETVKSLLSQVMLLKVDVTDYNANLNALQREWQVYGPPALLFFDANGKEIPSLRLVGELSTACFITHLKAWKTHQLVANCVE